MKHKVTVLITVLLLLCSVLLFRQNEHFFLIIAVIAGAFLGFTAYGSYQIKANYFITSINEGNPEGIALTFDDGPDPVHTPQILDILDKANVKATFFVIGSKAERHPSIILRMMNSGYIVANHSYSHSNMTAFFSTKNLLADIDKCSSIIQKISGRKPLFFRPPFGVTNPKFYSVLKKLKMTSIGWSIRSFDTTATNIDKLSHRITAKLTLGSILLLHDDREITVKTLPGILTYCEDNNIKISTLPVLINLRAYEEI